MILRIWYLSDAPENYIGNPYLHREVEEWISRIAPLHIAEDRMEAPDLAVTDARGVTTFVAAFGLQVLAMVDVQGMGLLEGYPGEMVFIGIAQKMIVSEPSTPEVLQTEETIDPQTGERFMRPIFSSNISAWKMPYEELRLRGLVVDKTTERQTWNYIESRSKIRQGKVIDLIL